MLQARGNAHQYLGSRRINGNCLSVIALVLEKSIGVDYIGLYQTHRANQNSPIEESLMALDSFVRAGKALYLVASSMYAWQFLKMLEFQKHPSTNRNDNGYPKAGDANSAAPASYLHSTIVNLLHNHSDWTGV
jgi:hypothetical protein